MLIIGIFGAILTCFSAATGLSMKVMIIYDGINKMKSCQNWISKYKLKSQSIPKCKQGKFGENDMNSKQKSFYGKKIFYD